MGGIINAVTKAVDPNLLSALSASLTVQYGVTIAPETVSKIQLNAPLLERLRSLGRDEVKPDKAATFAILTAAAFSGNSSNKAAFAVGGDPNSLNPQRELKSVTKKSYGASGGVKDVDVIASAMPGAPISINRDKFADDAEMLLNLLYAITLQGIDEDIVNGDATSDSIEFDGLETKVVSGTSGFYIDKVGQTLDTAMINQHVAWMMSRGVYPTAIYCNPIIHYAIVEAFGDRTKASINIVDGRVDTPLGLWASSIVTPAGTLPIVSDRFFSISADNTNVTGDVFFATEFHNGVRILYPEWQVLPTAVPLGKVMGRGRATSTELAVWAHLVLVERTEWWAQGRLANIQYAFAPSASTGTVGG